MPFVQELSNDYLHRSEFSVIPTAYISTKAQGTAVVVNSSQIKKTNYACIAYTHDFKIFWF
jgi:hypothetical protein